MPKASKWSTLVNNSHLVPHLASGHLPGNLNYPEASTIKKWRNNSKSQHSSQRLTMRTTLLFQRENLEELFTGCLVHLIPRWISSKKNCLQCRKTRFDLWVKKIPWRMKWQPTPVSLPGESHGQRSPVGYSPWGHKELAKTEHACWFTWYSVLKDLDMWILVKTRSQESAFTKTQITASFKQGKNKRCKSKPETSES